MFSKGHIVNISGKTYRVGEFTKGSVIGVCNHDGPIYASARFYHYVEDIFPYNDIKGREPIVFDDLSIKDFIISISQVPGSEEFIRDQIRLSEEFRSRIMKEWVKIGSKEYKITYAYGGQRLNVIYREPGDKGPIYNILFSDDADTLLSR